MNVQSPILSTYRFFLRQLRRIGLPIILLACYLTAVGLRRIEVLEPFERVEMELMHRGFGLLLCSVLVAILYDRMQRKKRSKGDLFSSSLSVKNRLWYNLKSLSPRVWVDRLFFVSLSLIAILGVMLHLKTRFGWSSLPRLELLYGLHSTLVWYFLSVILVRYYLTLSRWIGSLLVYLREN